MYAPTKPKLSRFAAKLARIHDDVSRILQSAADPVGEAHYRDSSHSKVEAVGLLSAIPDHIILITIDGAVRPISPRYGCHDGSGRSDSGGASAAKRANCNGDTCLKDEGGGLTSLCDELGRTSSEFVANVLETGEVQSFDLRSGEGGKTRYYDVRLAAYNEREVLALVRDVTARRESELALIRLNNDLETKLGEAGAELDRLGEALQNEVILRAGVEDDLRRSYGKLQVVLEDTIGAIVLIVQKKDPYTAGHQQRVSQLASAIGREMGLDSDRIRVVRLAALLHDLGKVFIPAEILAKPGELSKVEFAMVKEHPEADYQILKTIEFSCPIAEIVHQHHERMNGSGYPLGLKGDEILLESRIIAVADVVEAMIANRPHRPSRGMNEALKEITANKGVLYDPDVVDACVKLLDEGRFSFSSTDVRSVKAESFSASSDWMPGDSESRERGSKGGATWLK